MFRLEYTLSEGPAGELVLRFKRGMRFAMLLFALIVLGSIIWGGTEGGGLTFLPPLFFIFFLIAALYDERWVVDRAGESFSHRHGLVPPLIPAKRHRWSFQELDAMEISSFKTRKKMIRLSLLLQNGDRKDIEIADRKELEELERRGRALASAMGIGFRRDLQED